MEYMEFRSTLRSVFSDCGSWNVLFDWKDESVGEMDTMELEMESGPVYDLRIISVPGLYEVYCSKGWEAVLAEMERRPGAVRGRKGDNYRLLLNDEGKEMYEDLKALRARIARQRKIPPYIIFMNRTLFEMCRMLPVNDEQLLELYGVGEKNARLYGGQFLEKIREHTGGEWREMLCV